MNFLAHILLSGNQDDIMVGNFIADALPVHLRPTMPRGIQEGIRLHLDIDKFTDQHPIFKQSKMLLSPHYRHYSGVVVDVFYDYFLHKYWSRYSTCPLPSFVEYFYRVMEYRIHLFPPSIVHLYRLTKERKWLYKYATIDGLDEIFRGMDGRTKMKSGMTNATENLLRYESKLDAHFIDFFEELHSYVHKSLLI